MLVVSLGGYFAIFILKIKHHGGAARARLVQNLAEDLVIV